MSTYDLLTDSYDLPSAVPVTRRYLIASTPRSGSTLLAEGLMAAGMGIPAEYFDVRNTVQVIATRWGITDFATYLKKLHHLRSRSGVFGVKVHWHQLTHLTAMLLGPEVATGRLSVREVRNVLEQLLPDVKYVWIGRRDLDRQVVSHFVALGTGQWVDTGDGGEPPPPPPYDFGKLEEIRSYLATCEQAWARYFTVNGIEPLRIDYEDLAEDYASTMAKVVSYLGGSLAGPLPAPRLRKQSGSHTAHLLERYRAERRQTVAAAS